MLGPYDTSSVKYTQENSYLVSEWKQHGENLNSYVSFDFLKRMASFLAANIYTLVPVGPDYTPPEIGGDRRKELKRVIANLAVYDTNGEKRRLNCAELLYLMAKGLYNWFHSITPNEVAFYPSHVLPKYFYKRNRAYCYPISDRINWFDITQMWTMKPAVLQPAYR